MNIIYRLCELETNGTLKECRPAWFSKTKCLETFLRSVKLAGNLVDRVIFLHDGDYGPLYNYISNTSFEIIKVYYYSNKESLIETFNIAEQFDNDVYFTEDDYFYQKESVKKIALAVKKLGLVTGYDHLARYTITDDIDYKLNVIFDSQSNIHWRTSESTTGTWAASKDIFKLIKNAAKDFNVNDREFFRHLHRKNIPLWNAIPGIITHVDANLSPGTDWENLD